MSPKVQNMDISSPSKRTNVLNSFINYSYSFVICTRSKTTSPILISKIIRIQNCYLRNMRLPQHIVEEQERHRQEDELLLARSHRAAVNRGICLIYWIPNTLRSTNFCDSHFWGNLSVNNGVLFPTWSDIQWRSQIQGLGSKEQCASDHHPLSHP